MSKAKQTLEKAIEELKEGIDFETKRPSVLRTVVLEYNHAKAILLALSEPESPAPELPEEVIQGLEERILNSMSDLTSGYARRKGIISQQTGIPEDILTILLKRLKVAGKIELIMTWSEETGLPDGSEYTLKRHSK